MGLTNSDYLNLSNLDRLSCHSGKVFLKKNFYGVIGRENLKIVLIFTVLSCPLIILYPFPLILELGSHVGSESGLYNFIMLYGDMKSFMININHRIDIFIKY